MKTKSTLILLMLLVASACGNNKSGGGNDVESSSSALTNDEGSVLRQVNHIRQQAGLRSLVRDQAAHEEAGYFAQDRSDRRLIRGERACGQLRRRGMARNGCAEIYARWYTNISDTTDHLGLWLNTPRVRRLILDRGYRRAGVGVSSDRQGRTHGVLVLLP